MSDQEWSTIVQRITSGAPDGVAALMRAYGKELRGYAHALAGEDNARFAMLLEDILVDVLRVIGTAESSTEPLRFLFKCATATVRKHHQWVFREEISRRSKEPELTKLQGFAEPAQIETQFALSRLAPEERELLYLRQQIHLSLSDISEFCAHAMNRVEEDILVARQRFRFALIANRERLATTGGAR